MKIAVSSTGKDLDSDVSSMFGRCPYFIIAEIEDEKIKAFEAVENTSADQAGGAGISAAKIVAEKDVNAVISESVGPRALDVFRQFNIEVYSGNGSVNDTLQEFIGGRLKKIQ
ncbi:MAG: NifB/NifX family molybdenum-iron cluster-binding protein [Candidatus Aenigmarchaeota archaeon]|nr:NifB/NifX family molybdenum-iron cluster-binding protein [Candidatus Aenigmarchaeota archaeon]MCK5043125.1 NifB/NifX family molybdenum-iron cluster-binding protein [Candidatus Aenigmarchaeota archaeon]